MLDGQDTPGPKPALLTTDQIEQARVSAAGRRDACRAVQVQVRDSLITWISFPDDPKVRIRRKAGTAMTYILSWHDHPSPAEVMEAINAFHETGPVHFELDHTWSDEWVLSQARRFERWTGIPQILEPSAATTCESSRVWGFAPIAGRAAASWWSEFLDGHVNDEGLPRIQIRDLEHRIRTGVPEWTAEAVRRLEPLTRPRRATRSHRRPMRRV